MEVSIDDSDAARSEGRSWLLLFPGRKNGNKRS